jgi:hypothetical protein
VCNAGRLPRDLKLGHLHCDLFGPCGRHEIEMRADEALRQRPTLLIRLAHECAAHLPADKRICNGVPSMAHTIR